MIPYPQTLDDVLIEIDQSSREFDIDLFEERQTRDDTLDAQVAYLNSRAILTEDV